MLGKQIYSYRIEKFLGESDRGQVYLGVHTQLGRLATIEVIPRNFTQNQWDLEQIEQKADLLARLQHPNICTFYDYLQDLQGHYIVTEYVEGLRLDEYLRNTGGGLRVAETYTLFSQVLDALAYAHQQQIIHGHLSLLHIWLLPDKKVKVSGFGASEWGAFRDRPKPSVAEENNPGLSPYQSPESILKLGLSPRSDVYSLGVILWEMLSGRKPYASVNNNILEQSKRIISEPLPKLYGEVHKLLQAVIERATAKDQDIRYRHAGEFKEYFLLSDMPMPLPSVLPEPPAVKPQAPAPPYWPEFGERSSIAKSTGRSAIEYTLLLLVISLIAGFTLNPLRDGLFMEKKRPVAYRVPTGNHPRESPPVVDPPVVPNPPVQINQSATPPDTSEAEVDFYGNTPSDPEPKTGIEAALQNQIEEYYLTLHDKDIDAMMTFFEPPLKRFFNESDVSGKELKRMLQQSWKRTPEDQHEIMWETMRYRQDESGHYVVDYWMNYHYRRARRSNWRKQIIFTELTLNEELKIISMQGH